MAGRPKRRARLEAAGKWVAPKPNNSPASGIPAAGESAYVFERKPASGIPAQPPQSWRLETGHTSKRSHRQTADRLVAGLLGERPDLADYPEQLAAWSRAEARAVLFSAHLAKKGAFDENDELRGGLISAVNAAETAASKARIALGLTPASEAAIAKARAETASIVGVNLQSLADAGAAILAERGLHVIEGGAEAAG